MQYSEIMIRYGELSTKGKNRMRFINKLRNNISDVLSIYPQVKVTADRDRAHAYLNGADYTAVAESLKQVFGIQNFSPVYKIEKSVEVLKSAVQEIMKEIYKEGMTFKITSKRSDHNFELDSRELNQTLGGAVFEAIPNVQAQMKNPDIFVFSDEEDFAPHILTFGIKGVRGEVIVHAFEDYDIFISTTSACSSKAGKPAGTLIAMGVDKDKAQSAVRLSLDLENDMSQVEQFLTKLKLIYNQTRKVR